MNTLPKICLVLLVLAKACTCCTVSFAESIVLADPHGTSTTISAYDVLLKQATYTKEIPEVVVSLEAPSLHSLVLLIRKKQLHAEKFDLISGQSQRYIDASFKPLGFGSSDDSLLTLAAVDSFDAPVLAVFDRYGSYQRVFLRERSSVTAPRVSPMNSQVLYTKLSPDSVAIWTTSFSEPDKKFQLSVDSCFDSRFADEDTAIVLCSKGAPNSRQYEVSRIKIGQGNATTKLWSGDAATAPVLSRNGTSMIFSDEENRTILINLLTHERHEIPLLKKNPLSSFAFTP